MARLGKGLPKLLFRVKELLSHFGVRWLAFRAVYLAKLKLGWWRWRLPAGTWPQFPLTHFLNSPRLADETQYATYRATIPFFFGPANYPHLRENFAPEPAIAQAEQLLTGRIIYFDHLPVETGFPPHWQRNPLTDRETPANRHWSQIDDFALGDIKLIWEANRFTFVYALARAYAHTGDERYPAGFWQLLEDWHHHNPPQLGPNWKCGQETTFRVMAWLFGLYAFAYSPTTTPKRVAMLAQMVAVSGQRIETNLAYALSQQNNHGISEGLGLWTIGLLFPEFKESGRWREKGRRVLESQAPTLIDQDGAFAQHSFNYQRLMLHDYLWAIQLGQLHRHPLSQQLKDKIGQAGRFLYQLQDEITGRLPNYGQNDGAHILPLANCHSQDYRPVIQAIHYLTTGKRCYPAGPWDEPLLWLFGPKSLAAPLDPSARHDLAAAHSGYYTLRSPNGFVFTRCGPFQHRPGQADTLHLDLWWRGQNIALDPGTYSYNAAPPWNNPLAQTTYHNTVTVDGQEQMKRAGKFLWLPWLKAQATPVGKWPLAPDFNLAWQGHHNGYEALAVQYERAIGRLPNDGWLILDRLTSPAGHDYRLHWLLGDWPYEWQGELLLLHTPAGAYQVRLGYVRPGTNESIPAQVSLIRAEPQSPCGWQAPTYFQRRPALSLSLTINAPQLIFWTMFGPNIANLPSPCTPF